MSARGFLFAFIVLACPGLFLAAGQETTPPAKEVTFNHDVSRILNKNCVVCHRPNDIAPMSLMTYKDAHPFAKLIRDDVVARKMPPWHADPQVGEFLNDPRLSDADIATIDAWFRTGAKEGDPGDLPPTPAFSQGWHIKPDIVLTIPELTVSGATQDAYEYIYVPTNFTEDKWVQAAEVLPGDRRVVHHATVSVIAADKVAKKEEERSKSDAGVDKYHYRTGKVLHLRPEAPVVDDGCSYPTGGGVPGESSGYLNIVPGIYLPGHLAETRPPGYAL
ncbi:MAG: cytochrome c, partial [Acidobacteria bacterium]|nr:cytochrome c [Acidobacteriota bacterium]